MQTNDGLTPAPHFDDVVMVRWPEQRAHAERLTRSHRPYLLLVEPGAVPPAIDTCLADWIRLPADDVDMRARLSTLAARSEQHPAAPTVDELGELAFGGERVFLSRIDQQLAELLVASFDRVVPDQALFDQVWDGEGGANKVRVHVSRLRKRIAPLGLEISSLRGVGYRMHPARSRTRSQDHTVE